MVAGSGDGGDDGDGSGSGEGEGVCGDEEGDVMVMAVMATHSTSVTDVRGRR